MERTCEPQSGASETRYSRQDALRILHLQGRQVAAWERAGLIRAAQEYCFKDLGRLRTLRDLQAKRISAKSIRVHMDAMQQVAGVRNALGESSAVRRGAGLAFRYAGALLNPMTQQLAFDFGMSSTRLLRVVGGGEPLRRTQAVHDLFSSAIHLEEAEATRAEAAELYEQILTLQPEHAAASINLGTIRYGERRFAEAERLYRQATVADPEYALAFFDLGNVLDEMRRLDDAIVAYSRAIALVPEYADAHYNLALAYERQGQRRRALHHWLTYVRLDPVGPWSSHAKAQARKILSGEQLTIVSRRGRLNVAG